MAIGTAENDAVSKRGAQAILGEDFDLCLGIIARRVGYTDIGIGDPVCESYN
jgi:hypothetical protein